MIEILSRIRQAGGTIEVVGGDLRVKAPKGLLSSAERLLLAEHKAEIIKLLAAEMVVEDEPQDQHAAQQDDEQVEAVDVAPCSKCRSLELWQTAVGTWRCLRCDPPTIAIRALEKVQQIRRRHGLPARPETAAMLDGLRRMTSQAGAAVEFLTPADRKADNDRSRQGLAIPTGSSPQRSFE
jgi:hypothetical protein